MPTEKQLNETLEKISQDTNGFIAASLVDLDSGMTLAIKASRTEFDLTAALGAWRERLTEGRLLVQALMPVATA